MQFHVMRERYPEKFKSRARNKVWYAELGAGELLKRSCEGLHKSATLEVPHRARDVTMQIMCRDTRC
jgi:diacylglycerol kinase (ATP)